MRDFKNFESLFAYIEATLPINLEIIGEEVKNILKGNIEKLWYGRSYTPTSYTRTMEYLNSVQCSKARKVGGGYEIEIYFATDLILPHSYNNDEWPQHQSITDGEDYSPAIPYFIEYGNNPDGKSPIFEYKGVRPTGATKDWLNDTDYVNKRIVSLLGNYGFKVGVF